MDQRLATIAHSLHIVQYINVFYLVTNFCGLVLRNLRIEKAKRLLLYTSLSITEIALDVGFSSSQYFSRVFSKAEGVDPRTFRKMRSGIHGISQKD